MKNSSALKLSTLSLALALLGCGSSSTSTSGTFNNATASSSSNNLVGQGAPTETSLKFTVPTEGGTLTLPRAGSIQGVLKFRAGAAPGTILTLAVSETAPTGAPGPDRTEGSVKIDGFYYILWQTNQPFDFSLVESLVLSEEGILARAGEEIRGRVMPTDAELYHGELDTYSGSSGTYLDSLPGTFNSVDGTSTFASAESVQLRPGARYLLQTKAIDQKPLHVTITNDSEVQTAYVSVLGQSPLEVSPGVADPEYYHVDKYGKMQAFKKSDRNSRITTDPDGFVDGYTDEYNIKFVGKTASFDLPLMRAGRMYITLGRKMQTRIEDDRPQKPNPLPPPQPAVRLAQPDGWTNIGDPNFATMFDWLEFDYKVNIDTDKPGIGINKTEVDMMGYGVKFTLEGPTIGSKTVGTLDDGRPKIFADLEADSFFKELIVKTPALGDDGNPLPELVGVPLRAIAPVKGLDNRRNNRGSQYQYFDDTYFDSYLTAVWSYYETHDLKCYTSAFGVWFGRVNSTTQKMEFVCVQESNGDPARAGYQKIYLRKPSTTNAFEPTELITSGGITYEASPGNFVRVPDPPPVVAAPGPNDNPVLFTPYVANEIISALSAAMNRTTLLHEPLITRDYRVHPADKTKFYLKDNDQTKRINVYAKAIHDHSLTIDPDAPGPPLSNGGGAAYAFGFDDNSNQSSFIAELTNPTALKITILPLKP